ncbi:MAG: family 16 glycosylhydrolase [Pseudomonadota bacterium]
MNVFRAWVGAVTLFTLLYIPAKAISQAFADAPVSGFMETFHDSHWSKRWTVAHYDRQGSFATGWRPRLASVVLPARSRLGGFLSLELEPAQNNTEKPFLGAEVHTGSVHYGRYEVVMQPTRGDGLVSAFFTYTGPWFGDPHDEIDFEFLGRDTTKVWLNLFAAGDRLHGKWVDLGFDAAAAPRLYRFDWRPESVTWYANERELLNITSDIHAIPATPSKVYLQIWAGNEKMHQWLKLPDPDAAGNMQVYCVSYRPFDDEGPECHDYMAQQNE